MNIDIAPAIEDDIQDIEAMLAHGVRSKMNRGDLAWGEVVGDPEKLRAIVVGGNMYVAYTDDEIVGVFMLFWDDPARWGQQPPDAAYLHRFVVAPGLRGQNVGSQIIERICEEVAKNGRHYLRLTCPSSNTQLQSYHARNGFVRADHKAHPAGRTDPIAYFEKAISDEAKEDRPNQSQPKQSTFSKLRRHFGQQYN